MLLLFHSGSAHQPGRPSTLKQDAPASAQRSPRASGGGPSRAAGTSGVPGPVRITPGRGSEAYLPLPGGLCATEVGGGDAPYRVTLPFSRPPMFRCKDLRGLIDVADLPTPPCPPAGVPMASGPSTCRRHGSAQSGITFFGTLTKKKSPTACRVPGTIGSALGLLVAWGRTRPGMAGCPRLCLSAPAI